MKFNIDFNKNASKYFTISIIILALIILSIFIFGIQLDLQFKGGSIVTYTFDSGVDSQRFSDIAVREIPGVTVQNSTDITTGADTIVVTLPGDSSLSAEALAGLTETLRAEFPNSNVHTSEISNVDPSIGKEFLAKAITCLVLAMILVMLYVAFRFRKIGGLSAGVMGIIALLHDCVVVFGVFIICRIPINDNFIAVILTILGFSLNATIVIYDRIRENKQHYGSKMKVGELTSLSINQSFTRSVNTSITAIIAMLVVTIIAAIYKVDSIYSFSFPLILGLISGAYSSVCLAGPLWVKWQEYKARKKAA